MYQTRRQAGAERKVVRGSRGRDSQDKEGPALRRRLTLKIPQLKLRVLQELGHSLLRSGDARKFDAAA